MVKMIILMGIFVNHNLLFFFKTMYYMKHLQEMSRVGKSKEKESRLVVPRTEEWGGHLEKQLKTMMFWRVGRKEKVELDCGDGCKTPR